jgi:hypothetical protein
MDPLRCTACGIQADGKCSCRKPYDYITRRDAAALALAAHPDWSDRRIAEALGVERTPVRQARKAIPSKEGGETKRVGRDGNMYPARWRKVKNSPEKEAAAAAMVLDQSATYGQAIAKTGIDGSLYAMKLAVVREEGRRENIDAALQAHQRVLDEQFEMRMQAEIQRRVRELVLPTFQEQQDDAAFVIRHRKGIFKEVEYNTILRCLHPDLHPSIEQKNEAFRLWHARKLVLMSEKDDPRQYKSLPSMEEFMAGAKKSA